MRYLKYAATAISLMVCFFFAHTVSAIEVVSPVQTPVLAESPIIITGYAHQGPRVQYVQLFNTSDKVIDLAGREISYDIAGVAEPIVVAQLQSLIKPGGYLIIANAAAIPSADVLYNLSIPAEISGAVTAIHISPSATYADHSVVVKTDSKHAYWKRNISSSTGAYLSTFTAFTPDASYALYGNGWYDYPEQTALQITEILAHPRGCSPVDTAGDCMDYVKIYNPTNQAVDLSQLRLRVGYKGQNATTSNAFALNGILPTGQYGLLTMSADNRPISLANSGAFVWFEDMYGMKLYESTLVQYPDASAETRQGQAWAYDATDQIWKWTAQPMPFNAPSVFPLPPPPKQKVSVSNTLAPCKEGQYRSEETNRCRSIASEATVVAPCDDDEERNPATNRCRKIVSLASQQLAACKEGQERNPETNRCRNVLASTPSDAAFAVQTVGETGKAFMGWWALGGVGVLALGYGIWEWRSELVGVLQKVGTFFTSGK